MEEYVNLALNLPKELYEYISERGFVEICSRDIDKKFKAFTKCLINQNGPEVEKQLAKQVLNNPMQNARDLRKFARNMGKNINQIAQGISTNAAMLQSMSDSMGYILQGVSKVQNLGWLNAGLNIANLGATAAGFAVMYIKLDAMSGQISQLGCSIEQLKAIAMQFHVEKEYETLCADSKIYFSNIASNYEVPHDVIEDLLKRYGIFIKRLLCLVDKEETERLLQIIYDVLPVFNQLIISYYENFYGHYEGNRHPLHSDWMNIFNAVNGDAFRNVLRDYYFLDCELSNTEVNTILDGQFVLNCDMISQINDTLTFLDAVGSTEKYKEIKAATNESVAEMAKEYQPTLADIYGEDEARAILREALENSIGYAAVA